MAGPRMTSRRSRISSSVAPDQLGMLVGLVEVAGHDPGAEAHARRRARRPRRRPAGAGSGSCRRRWPEHGDALAEPDLGVERVGEPGQLEALDGERPCGRCARHARRIVDPLLLHLGRRCVALVEVPQPALGGLGLRRERVGVAGPLLQLAHDAFQPVALALVQLDLLLDPLDAGLAGLVVAGERAAVGPRALGLDGDDLGGRRRQQLAVVADVQDRLRATPAARLPASACPRRRGSCRARRAAGRRARPAAAPRARGASARPR